VRLKGAGSPLLNPDSFTYSEIIYPDSFTYYEIIYVYCRTQINGSETLDVRKY